MDTDSFLLAPLQVDLFQVSALPSVFAPTRTALRTHVRHVLTWSWAVPGRSQFRMRVHGCNDVGGAVRCRLRPVSLRIAAPLSRSARLSCMVLWSGAVGPS
eukprot:2570538-Rhodomonas_salina.1